MCQTLVFGESEEFDLLNTREELPSLKNIPVDPILTAVSSIPAEPNDIIAVDALVCFLDVLIL